MNLNTATVSLAVTPTVVSTLLLHYTNRKPLRQRPTAHLSYDEGLHLIKSFLKFASHHTVEELQAFTAQWVPHPQWVKLDRVEVPEEQLTHAAAVLEAELGPEGIRKVGGRKWWQWRQPKSPLKAEWIEMKSDYNTRKRTGDPLKRVMLYVHGGAYFFGSVDMHRYQMQRHARKLRARIFAPQYRLAPQFPFPCGIQDCLAAYLYLLTFQEPNTIILAGDSAGGGMVVSMLVALRNQGVPLPAGAVLVSPWVDLTHSFPSVAEESPFDYIPQSGFHHKPSLSWPPPNDAVFAKMLKEASEKKGAQGRSNSSHANAEASADEINLEAYASRIATNLSIALDGNTVELTEQIQMYATNELLDHPLVSPILQPTLGGLPPLLVMTGGGECLRDEQIYLAHKCANPLAYLPAEDLLDERARKQIEQYKPTDVQLQVWDDMCHVAPTLSFTRPAKFMYRSIAQFGAWALARAQRTEIDILDDDEISVISESGSDSDETERTKAKEDAAQPQVGKAGDPLPPFRGHMIRQRVTRHGAIYQLRPVAELPGCTMKAQDIGVVKAGPVRKWLSTRHQWDLRFTHVSNRVFKKRLKDMTVGYESFGLGEYPPPCALASRRKIGADLSEGKKTRSMGLSLWSLWGSKHDESTVVREREADKEPQIKTATENEGANARQFIDIESQGPSTARPGMSTSCSRSRRRVVKDDHQTEGIDEGGSTGEVMAMQKQENQLSVGHKSENLTPNNAPDTGVTSKRPRIEGISMPFTINREAETASMVTLTSNMESAQPQPQSRPMSPEANAMRLEEKVDSKMNSPADATSLSGVAANTGPKRPGVETFVTAAGELPRAEVPQDDGRDK